MTVVRSVCPFDCPTPAVSSHVLAREDLLPRPTRIVNMDQLGDALGWAEPPIRAMYVWGSNPAAVAPDQNAVLRGLAREGLGGGSTFCDDRVDVAAA